MKRIVLLQTLLLLVVTLRGNAAQPEGFDALMARGDEAFRKGTLEFYSGDLPYSSAQLCRLTARAFRVDPTDLSTTCRLFCAACDCGNAATLPDLINLFFEVFPADADYERREVFCALAGLWLRVQVPGALEPSAKFLPPPLPSVFLPGGYPKKLRSALDRYREVSGPCRDLFEKERNRDWIAFQTHQADYWKLVGQMLRREKGPFTEKILAYGWGGGCGTGSEVFLEPHSYAILLALVSDRRWAQAAGAAMAVQNSQGFRGAARVLSACVSDAADVLVGGLAYADREKQAFWMESRTAPLLGLLLNGGGDDRVRSLIALAAQAPPEAISSYFTALARFLPVKESAGPPIVVHGSFGIDLMEVAVRPVSPKTQEQAWSFLCAQATAPLSVEAAKTLIGILGSRPEPSSMEALRQLLAFPSSSVVAEAARMLQQAGQKADIPPQLGPLRYRIVVDGKRYAKHPVQWAVNCGETGQSSDTWTDENGVLEVPRDIFFDRTSNPVRRFALRSKSMDNLEDAWWGVLLPLPPASDKIIPVEIKTQPLTIKLPLLQGSDWANRKMDLTLWGEQSRENQSLGLWGPIRFKITPRPELHFARMMAGTYSFEVRVPGATVWKGDIPVAKSPEFTIPLKQASDVAYEVRPPKGLDQWFFIPSVLQNGKPVPVDWDNNTNTKLRGVPIGKYVLHFPSRSEMKGRFLGMEPPGVDFPATDVPFEVRTDSPTEINLGPIAIRRE